MLDGAVTLLDSVAGVEPQTETVWRQADRYKVPRLIFANKMDRVGADFDRCMRMIKDRLTRSAYPIQLPVGSGETFTGHIDVIERKQYIFDDESLGKKFEVAEVPEEYREAMREGPPRGRSRRRSRTTKTLIEKYLERRGADDRRDPSRDSQGDDRVASSCRCCAARRSRTRACRRCSTRSIDYLPSPVDVPAVEGHLPHDDEHSRSAR